LAYFITSKNDNVVVERATGSKLAQIENEAPQERTHEIVIEMPPEKFGGGDQNRPSFWSDCYFLQRASHCNYQTRKEVSFLRAEFIIAVLEQKYDERADLVTGEAA
jgi:hypothetical protein